MEAMPYEPTWTADNADDGLPAWAVYDQREGFTPAYALVYADNADEAAEDAIALAPQGRLEYESETLVVRRI